MARKKPTHCEIKRELRDEGVDFREDFFALRGDTVGLIVNGAKRAGYRKSKNAPGSLGRMYFQLLRKKSC